MSSVTERPASCPVPGQIPAFDAGWDAHELGFERKTVEVLVPESGRGFALMAWDIREKISPRAASERTVQNRTQRQSKIDRAIDESTRMLLDGLEVDSIRTLKAIVDGARKASRIYEGLRVDANDGEFALWRDVDLVNALHELGDLFR